MRDFPESLHCCLATSHWQVIAPGQETIQHRTNFRLFNPHGKDRFIILNLFTEARLTVFLCLQSAMQIKANFVASSGFFVCRRAFHPLIQHAVTNVIRQVSKNFRWRLSSLKWNEYVIRGSVHISPLATYYISWVCYRRNCSMLLVLAELFQPLNCVTWN